MPAPSRLAIVALWSYVLLSAPIGAAFLLHVPVPRGVTPAMVLTASTVPVLFFAVAATFTSHHPFYHPLLARFVDRRFGAGAFASFLVRLKPLLLFATSGVLCGLPSVLVARWNDAPPSSYVLGGLFISGGIGFALAHLILYRRRMVGVYPDAAGP